MLALRLPEDIERRLDGPARKTGRTKSYYAREAIIEHIEDLEDAYLAEERLRTTDGTTMRVAGNSALDARVRVSGRGGLRPPRARGPRTSSPLL